MAAPPSGFSLVIVGATVPSIDPSGRGCPTWDCNEGGGNNPDPYVRETARVYRTLTLANSLSPDWNEVVAAGLDAEDLTQPFRFELIDEDDGVLNDSDHIVTFVLSLRRDQVAPGRFELTDRVGGANATLTVEIR